LRFTIRACGAKREKSPEQGMHELRLAYSLLMRFGIAIADELFFPLNF